MARIGRIHRGEILKTFVFACENAVFDVRIHIAVPMFTKIGGQPAVEPARHMHQIIVGDVGADRRALHHPVGIDIHQAAANHLVQMGTVSVKIDVDFRAVNIGYTALIVEILIVVGEIGFSEVGLRVVHNDLEFLLGGVIQQFFNFGYKFRRLIEDVLRQRPTRWVIIDIVLFSTQILPVELLVLYTAFAERKLRTVVELRVT